MSSGAASAGHAAPVRRDRLDALAIGLLLSCCLFWGLQQVLIKLTLAEMPPVFQAWLRLGGATVLLLLWCRWRGVSLLQRDGTLWAGLLAGLLFAGEFICIYTGLERTGSARLTVFLYTSPFWVALLVPLWTRSERLHGLQWAGLVLAFGAVAFALREGLTQGEGATLAGDLLGLAADRRLAELQQWAGLHGGAAELQQVEQADVLQQLRQAVVGSLERDRGGDARGSHGVVAALGAASATAATLL